MQEETLQNLRKAFRAGCNNTQACSYAGISTKELVDYERDNPTFILERAELDALPAALSKIAVFNKIKRASVDEEADPRTDAEFAKWYLERKEADFQPKSKQDVTSAGKALPTLIQIVQPHE